MVISFLLQFTRVSSFIQQMYLQYTINFISPWYKKLLKKSLTPYKRRRYFHVYDSITMSVSHLGNSNLVQKDNNTCREHMLISKTKKVFIITFNAPNKEREKLIFCVRFLMRYCENAETEASFIIYRKVSNNNYFLFLILRSITIYLTIIQCVLFIDIG